MPVQAIADWLDFLETEAAARDVPVDTDIDGRIFHFELGDQPGVIGKVRTSEGKARNYENEQGQKHIWHRYNRELERIEENPARRVVNVTLDIWDKQQGFDPESDHFIFLTQELLTQDTYSKGDQKIWIEGDGEYSGPLANHVDDWDAIIDYATTDTTAPPGTTAEGPESPASESAPALGAEAGTEGTVVDSRRSEVRVRAAFRERALEEFGCQCPLSGVETPSLLTVCHILPRAEHEDVAEDIENVIVLDWTHHMAFDAGLWTFDESGRIWVNPDFQPASEMLQSTILDRHGEKIPAFTSVTDAYIEAHNESLAWWPPR